MTGLERLNEYGPGWEEPMPTDSPDQRFANHFWGNSEAYGTEQGGRADGHLADAMARHLDGTERIGVYPWLEHREDDDTGYVYWGCVDLDLKTPDKPAGDYPSFQAADAAARRLVQTLDHFDIPAYQELSRSGGVHVWVFGNSILAHEMRRALLVACKVAGVSDREVNPKQETLPYGKLGNYVRLPYPGRGPDENGNRVFYNDRGEGWGYEEAMRKLRQAPPGTLPHLASFWQPRPRKIIEPVRDFQGGRAPNPSRIVDWAAGGVPEDRSAALWWIANTLFESGVQSGEVVETLSVVAGLWGKFKGRERVEAERMVRKVCG